MQRGLQPRRLDARLPEPGEIRVWAVDIDDLLEIARRNVTRSLSEEECRQYLHLESCPAG
ncbi:MAG TPA: hypothetical protein VJO36_02485 [Actinomycetota bacterium]|nr:hypothetical protein [Actinomycetota bacterium]